MKALKWSVIGLLVILLALPGVLGFLLEQNLEQKLTKALDANQPQVDINLVSFERGWFNSRAIIGAKLDPELVASIVASGEANDDSGNADPASKAEIEMLTRTLDMQLDMHHGPIGFDDELFLGLLSWTCVPATSNPEILAFQAEHDLADVFTAAGLTGFLGRTDLTITVPSFNPSKTPTTTLVTQFSGLILEGYFKITDASFDLAGSFDELEFAAPELDARLSGATFSTDGRLLARSSLAIGNSRFAIASVTGHNNETNETSLFKNIVVTTQLSQGSSPEVLDSAMNLSAERFEFGTGTLENAKFGMKLEDLSEAAFMEYNEQAALMAKPDANPEQTMLKIESILRQFLQHSPRLTIMPFSFTYNGDTLSGGLNVGFDAAGLSKIPNIMGREPTAWLQDIGAQAMLDIDKGMAEAIAFDQTRSQIEATVGDNPNITPEQIDQIAEAQVPALLDGLRQQGAIKDNGDSYGAVFTYIKGELKLNDQPFPIEQLLGQ